MHAKAWNVRVYIDEHDDGGTRAEARLTTGDSELSGIGIARQNPTDPYLPEVGDELAVARALSALAHRLLHAATSDVASITRQRVKPQR